MSEIIGHCLRTPNSKFYFEIVAYCLGAGPQKMLTVTLKWGTFLYFTFLKVFKQNVFLVYFKAKNEEKLKKSILLLTGQEKFAHFYRKFISNFLFVKCYFNCICKFPKKFIFKVFFKKRKLWRARCKIRRYFGIGLIKNT